MSKTFKDDDSKGSWISVLIVMVVTFVAAVIGALADVDLTKH
jgi:preprotein translocase subunit SecE